MSAYSAKDWPKPAKHYDVKTEIQTKFESTPNSLTGSAAERSSRQQPTSTKTGMTSTGPFTEFQPGAGGHQTSGFGSNGTK